MFLTVAVSVFNESHHIIERCINSILSQEYEDFDILIIDDGSKLDTADFCDRISSRYQKVKTIHQSNLGLSCSRNRAIEESNSQYIMFVDADDYLIDKTLIKKLFLESNFIEYDILTFGHTSNKDIYFPDKSLKKINSYLNNVSKKNLQLDYLNGKLTTLNKNLYLPSSWAKIYKLSFIKNSGIKFSKNLIRDQDGFFNLQCYSRDAKIGFLPIIGYYFNTDNPSSVTRSLNRKNIEYMDEYLKSLENFVTINHFDNIDFEIALCFQRYKALINNANRIYFHPSNQDSFNYSYKQFKEEASSINKVCEKFIKKNIFLNSIFPGSY